MSVKFKIPENQITLTGETDKSNLLESGTDSSLQIKKKNEQLAAQSSLYPLNAHKCEYLTEMKEEQIFPSSFSVNLAEPVGSLV